MPFNGPGIRPALFCAECFEVRTRGETPRAIIEDIVSGMQPNYRVVEDRAMAIYQAIDEAHEGDIVLIAGKGHETHQEINGAKLPFNDVEVAKAALHQKA